MQALKKGDKVAIVATAKVIDSEPVEKAVHLLQSWGLEVEVGKNTLNQDRLFAGTDTERLSDIQLYLDRADIKAIFCARGGYGTIRIVDAIDYSSFKKSPKWIIGFSDITVLHSHIQSNFSFPTIHATMPIDYERNTQEALGSLKNSLFGDKNLFDMKPNPLNIQGEVEAEVVGGNLSILYSLLGTNSSPNYKGKILLIEDLTEFVYHIDRIFYSFNKAGVLNQLSGIIIGGFTDMKQGHISFEKDAYEVMYDHVKELGIPVCFNFPSGHFADNRAVVLGDKGRLIVRSDKVTFTQ